MSLNNPYYLYPGYPLSGYTDLKEYNKNLIDLNEYIKQLTTEVNTKILLHLTIGSAAEELNNSLKKNIDFQWQQLLPEHVQRYAKKNNMKVLNIIISPSSIFKDKYNPLFIKNTPKYYWDNSDKNSYKSQKYNLLVKTFYCPLPSNCDYTKFMDKMKSTNLFDDEYLSTLEQTMDDKKFIIDFYNNLKILFNKVNEFNGIVTCFSYAVFNAETNNSKYNNYYLFRELTNLFDNDKRILAEWVYRIGFYSVINYKTRELISFVKPKTLDDNTLKHNDINLLNINTLKTNKYIYKNVNDNHFINININNYKVLNNKSK